MMIVEAICRASKMPDVHLFDFEGSMLEPVEGFFRGFNPVPVIYFNIRKEKWPVAMHIFRKFKRK